MRVKSLLSRFILIRKREVFSLFADQSIPRAYLFGKDGKLIYTSTGYTPEEFQKLMDTIEEALK